MHVSVCIPLSLSLCPLGSDSPSISLVSVCPPARPPARPPMCLPASISLHLSLSLSVCVSLCLSLSLSVSLRLSLSLSLSLTLSLSLALSLAFSRSFSLSLSLPLSPSLCLPLSLPPLSLSLPSPFNGRKVQFQAMFTPCMTCKFINYSGIRFYWKLISILLMFMVMYHAYCIFELQLPDASIIACPRLKIIQGIMNI